jgi:RimJ/RimL family protein N-acetyltransferase
VSVRLRPVRREDGQLLWVWANDPETRRASGGREEISWSAHTEWLAARLQDAGCRLWILESPGKVALGTIRFDSDDGWASARLSYAVGPEHRRRGYGRELVARGVGALRREHPGALIEALVQPDNVASRALFERLGWRLADRAGERLRFVNDGREAACPSS